MWLLLNTVTTAEKVIHANKSTVLSRFYLIILLSHKSFNGFSSLYNLFIFASFRY